MKITRVDINNFLAIGEATISLDDRGLVLIQGENTDDPSASSNGAGKSSVVDAICWAIYGVTARGAKGDAVVNEAAGKDCLVGLEIQDGDMSYLITRHRKHSSMKNMLHVTSQHLSDPVVTLTKGTDAETQKVVESIIGCSHEVFTASIYAGQEQMPDLPGMTDKNLKILIEQSAGTRVLEACHQEARVQLRAIEVALSSANSDLKTRKSQLELTEESLVDARNRRDEFEAKRHDDVRVLAEKIDRVTTDIEAVKEAIDAEGPLAKVNARIKELEAILAAPRDMTAMDTATEKLNSARIIRAKVMNGHDEASRQMKTLQRRIDHLRSSVGTPCSACKRPHTEESVAAEIASLSAELAEQNKVFTELGTKLGALEAVIEKLTVAEIAAREALAVVDPAVTSELESLRRKRDALAGKIKAVDMAVLSLEADKAKFLSLKTAPNPYDASIKSWGDAAIRQQDEIKELEGKIAVIEAEYTLANNAVAVFGPAGVRAHILDTVTPFLNARTSEYLGALSDGSIEANWTTLSRTKAGEVREKFSIDVSSRTGGSSFSLLSGGEKRKVRLATAMALQDLVASRAFKPIRLFVADEVDHALDEAGLERLMGVLQEKAKHCGTVLVISHNSLADWIDQVVSVTKSGRRATLSGAIA